MKIFALILLGIAGAGFLLWIWLKHKQFGRGPNSADIERFCSDPHFDRRSQKFLNIVSETTAMVTDPWGLIRMWLFGQQVRTPTGPFPSQVPDLEAFVKKDEERVKWLWLGHSTFFVNFDGTLILFDPVLGVASPLPFLVRRFSRPLLTLSQLPKPDIIVLSHDHYDHLDANVMREIGTWPIQPEFFVPLGLASRLRTWNIKADMIHELAWYQSIFHQGMTLTATPAQHFSGRSFADKNHTLWSGWLLNQGDFKLYYSGDGGYAGHFKDIGDRYGPIDLAFLECGQYNRNWRYVHMLPEEVVMAAKDVRAGAIVPIHWGMFVLALHDWFEPIEKVTSMAAPESLPVWHPKLGELVRFGQVERPKAWWRTHPDFLKNQTQTLERKPDSL
ncbi:MAG: MBL fold metallo-hydrolase [Chitinophagaceae bacterium]|nr:MBL fold metallo-hydrolase [Oligoflexus sp.]